MLAVIAPLVMTNIAVDYLGEVFATDASSAKGAIIQAPIPRTTETILWLEIKNLGMCSWTILFVRSCVGLGSLMEKRACPLKPVRLKVLSKLL